MSPKLFAFDTRPPVVVEVLAVEEDTNDTVKLTSE